MTLSDDAPRTILIRPIGNFINKIPLLTMTTSPSRVAAHRPGALTIATAFALALAATSLLPVRPIRAQGSDVLYACYAPSTGDLYRIKAPGLPTSCNGPKSGPNQHVEVSWNVQGPRGPQGLQGPAGAQGVLGDVGPQGPAGAAGLQGDRGLQGTPGSAGAAGAAGPVGPQGPQGLQGQQGVQGSAGQPGSDGKPGASGAQGPAGPQGETGAAGPAGAAGAIGPEGPAGPQGLQGSPGTTGAAGLPGATGPQGPTGPQGLPGPEGPQGVAGGLSVQAVPIASIRLHTPGAQAVLECPADMIAVGLGGNFAANTATEHFYTLLFLSEPDGTGKWRVTLSPYTQPDRHLDTFDTKLYCVTASR